MADKVPFDILRQRKMLLAQLLFVTLAKHTLTLLVGCLDILVRVIFRDSHKANTLWQCIEHLVQMGFNVVIHHRIVCVSYCCSYSGLSFFLPYS